jgi:hypothetical protein
MQCMRERLALPSLVPAYVCMGVIVPSLLHFLPHIYRGFSQQTASACATRPTCTWRRVGQQYGSQALGVGMSSAQDS